MKSILKHALLGSLLLSVGFVVGFKVKESLSDVNWQQYFDNLRKFEEVMEYVNENYFEEVDNSKLIDDAIVGMLEGLDPHSFYIPREQMEYEAAAMEGSFEGIGVEFNLLDDTIMVVAPIEGGPSEKLGIRAGDRIVEIDGKNVAGVGFTNNDVIKSLRGTKGSKVTVGIIRPGVKNMLTFTINRDKIPIHSVTFSYMVDRETGYIKVSRFNKTTFDEFQQHLATLKKKGLKNLILDLRGNPGGYMYQAQLLGDAFITAGKKIVYTEGRIPESNSEYISNPAVSSFEEGGLVVLIDEGSASASEIVSGAVQDYDRGLVVGRRSFGKGLVQTQKQLQDGSAVRVVVSRYFTPSGRCIQKPFQNMKSDDYNDEVWDRFETGEVYAPTKTEFPDSLKYKTAAGRTVYGGGGIYPDVFVPRDTSGTSEYLSRLLMKGIFSDYSFRYRDKNAGLKGRYQDGIDFREKFDVTEDILQDFIQFATDHEVTFNEAEYNNSKTYIKMNIKAFIGRSLFSEEGYYPVLHMYDETFRRGMELVPAAIKLKKTGKFNP
jgi:carboxyl-terminal processing protease